MNPVERKFLEHIRLRQLLETGGPVLVAVSGGPDSMALLHLFIAVRPLLRCEVAAAHCNFRLRGEESDLDEAFVRDACQALGIACHVRRFETRTVASSWKRSLEETARIQRYGFFDELVDAHGYTAVATGHHVGDNAETMLFNLFRGASLPSLKGIRPKHGTIIRPLLPFGREEIVDYLEARGIPWRVDQSNLGVEYDRNFIRNRVIPLVEERFRHKLLPSLMRLSEHASELDEFVEGHVGRLIEQHPGLDIDGGRLHVVTMRGLTLFERKEVVKRVLESMGASVDSRVLQRIAGLLERQSGRSVPAGKGIVVTRRDGFLRFERPGGQAGGEAAG